MQQSSPINGLIIAGLIINTLITVLIANQPEQYPDSLNQILLLVMAGFLLLSISGVMLMFTDKFNAGSILAIIGFIGFVPIGLIGAIGVRKAKDARVRQQAGLS